MPQNASHSAVAAAAAAATPATSMEYLKTPQAATAPAAANETGRVGMISHDAEAGKSYCVSRQQNREPTHKDQPYEASMLR